MSVVRISMFGASNFNSVQFFRSHSFVVFTLRSSLFWVEVKGLA